MTDYSKRVFEAIVRVLVFRSAHPELFPKDSQADQLLQKVEAISRMISSQSTSQASGKNDVRISAEVRTSARENLRKDLESNTRTAASMGLKQFFMPRERSDLSSTDVGRIFAANAEPLNQEFIANHMPEDFIERLKAGIEKIERSIEQQAASKGARKVATTALTHARTEAIAVLARLDPLMDNLLRENAPMKAAWDAARRVEKAATRKKHAETPPAGPTDKAAYSLAGAASGRSGRSNRFGVHFMTITKAPELALIASVHYETTSLSKRKLHSLPCEFHTLHYRFHRSHDEL